MTERLPKLLLAVAGRPFVDHQLEWMEAQGVDDVVYCIGHLGRLVRQHFLDRPTRLARIRFVDEGDELRGTAGALRLALDEGVLADRFLVLYGDSYLDVDLSRVWEVFLRSSGPALMTVFRNRGRWDRSNVLFRDGRVVRYDKTAVDPSGEGMEHIDYGLLAFQREVIESMVPTDVRYDLAEVQRRLSERGELAGFEATRRFYEIGSPDGLAELEAHLT